MKLDEISVLGIGHSSAKDERLPKFEYFPVYKTKWKGRGKVWGGSTISLVTLNSFVNKMLEITSKNIWNWKSFFVLHVRWLIWKLINICNVSLRLFHKLKLFSSFFSVLLWTHYSIWRCRYCTIVSGCWSSCNYVWSTVCTSYWVHHWYSVHHTNNIWHPASRAGIWCFLFSKLENMKNTQHDLINGTLGTGTEIIYTHTHTGNLYLKYWMSTYVSDPLSTSGNMVQNCWYFFSLYLFGWCVWRIQI